MTQTPDLTTLRRRAYRATWEDLNAKLARSRSVAAMANSATGRGPSPSLRAKIALFEQDIREIEEHFPSIASDQPVGN